MTTVEKMTRKDNMRLHELQVRVVDIAHLGSMFTDMYSPPDVVTEMIESLVDASPKFIPPALRGFFKMAKKYDEDNTDLLCDFLSEHIHGHELYGFVVRAEKPADGSWGCTYSQWFYGSDWAEVMTQVEAWAKQK